jgi:hypothetical protein
MKFNQRCEDKDHLDTTGPVCRVLYNDSTYIYLSVFGLVGGSTFSSEQYCTPKRVIKYLRNNRVLFQCFCTILRHIYTHWGQQPTERCSFWLWMVQCYMMLAGSIQEYKFFYLLTYGAEPFLRSCQLCSHSRNSQVHHRVHKNPSLVLILSQFDPVHTIPSCLSKIHIILYATKHSHFS